MGEGDGIEMSVGVSLARSFARVVAAAAVVEEAVVHLEPAERILADVTSRGVIGRQGEEKGGRAGVLLREQKGLGCKVRRQ